MLERNPRARRVPEPGAPAADAGPSAADDQSAPAEPIAALAFDPVPLARRHDGWSPDRQRRFIAALADLGSVLAAARTVNMSEQGAYALRRHPGGGAFREAWDAALALGVRRLEDIAMDRALNGVEVPVFYYGEVVGTRRAYNDTLLMFLLRNRSPDRFAADSLQNANAAKTRHLARLKREWRAEWEAEQRAETTRNSAQVTASLYAKLDLMRQRHLTQMSPRTTRLREAFEESKRRDQANGYVPGDEKLVENGDEDAE